MSRSPTFLDSRSMLTPGLAGAVTMLLANTLYQQFALPQKWTAIALSFALGLLVFGDRRTALWQRILLYVLNSLIIFSMAVGANTVGQAVTSPRASPRGLAAHPSRAPVYFGDWL
jgi:phosphate/sulfate permease